MSKAGTKNKIQKPLTLTQIYQYYIKDIDNNSKYNIDYKLFRKICEEFNKSISSLIIDSGYFFKIPYRLGTIRIKKGKVNVTSKSLKMDFGLLNSSDGKYKNKHLNEHSGGYYVRFHWNKLDMIIKNKSLYSFIPTRFNKRALASIVKQDGVFQINKYFE